VQAPHPHSRAPPRRGQGLRRAANLVRRVCTKYRSCASSYSALYHFLTDSRGRACAGRAIPRSSTKKPNASDGGSPQWTRRNASIPARSAGKGRTCVFQARTSELRNAATSRTSRCGACRPGPGRRIPAHPRGYVRVEESFCRSSAREQRGRDGGTDRSGLETTATYPAAGDLALRTSP